MLRRPARLLRSPNLPLVGSVTVNRARNSRQQTSFTGQRAFDLSSSWNGVLTRDELEQVMQQRRIANSILSFPQRDSAANNASFAGELTSVSFYGYPGVPRSGGYVVQGDGQPAIANVPVLPALPTAPGTQPPSTGSMGSGDPSAQATVQSYIY